MSREMHIVLGAGPLGIAAATALLRRGHTVHMVSRSGSAPVGGVTALRADLTDAAQVAALAAGAAAVYQCAQPHYHQWGAQFEQLQSAIIDGVGRAGARLIVAENLYMYGQVDGPIHEGLPHAAHTRKGRVRARMAEQLAEAHRSGAVRAASARGSDFFGPWVRGSALGERVFGPALRGQAAQAIGRLDLPHSYTAIDDFGEALATLGEHDAALGQAWHVPTAPAITQRELIGMIYAQLGLAPRISATGRVMLSLAGLLIPGARETVEMLYEFERPFVVDSSRFTAAFGLRPTPLEETVRRTLAWYRAADTAQLASAH